MTGQIALQASPKADLTSILANSAVVHEQEVGMTVIEIEAVRDVDRAVVGIVGHLSLSTRKVVVLLYTLNLYCCRFHLEKITKTNLYKQEFTGSLSFIFHHSFFPI